MILRGKTFIKSLQKGIILSNKFSFVYKELYDYLFKQLARNYENEEKEIKKTIEIICAKEEFNPIEYGQDKLLIKCSFSKSSKKINLINDCKTPFEKMEALRVVHKQIVGEIEEFAAAKKLPKIALNEDIVIASLMTAFLNSGIEHPIVNMLILQNFSYVEYCIGEMGKINII